MADLTANVTWVEALTVITVFIGCVIGFRSGFFPEILRVISYIITVLVTLQFNNDFARYLTVNTFLNTTTASVVAFSSLLVGMFIATKLVTMLFVKMLKANNKGVFNKLFGMVLGGARWLILLSLVFMLINFSVWDSLKTDIRQRSIWGPQVSKIAPTLFEFLAHLSPQFKLEHKP